MKQARLIVQISSPLAGPPRQSPPKCKTQCLGQTSVPVQNFSQICPEIVKNMSRTDSKLNITLLPWGR